MTATAHTERGKYRPIVFVTEQDRIHTLGEQERTSVSTTSMIPSTPRCELYRGVPGSAGGVHSNDRLVTPNSSLIKFDMFVFAIPEINLIR
jgi:hypothetical protein